MWLVKYLKTLVPEHNAIVIMVKSLKTCPTALSTCNFATLQKIELENVRLSVSEILQVFVKTLTADIKYFLCSRKNLLQPVQLQLSKKLFFHFFAAYLKSTSHFEHFDK